MIDDKTYRLQRGARALLISIPHCGTELPAALLPRLRDPQLARLDADWHVERLYGFAPSLGVGMLTAVYSRTVVDLNRPPDDAALYPGMQGTGLCPLTTFDGEALYRDGQEPDDGEIRERAARYWTPYHQALEAELARLLQAHGRVLLFEAHSIRSVVPRLFDGRLADLNLGSYDGASCDAALRQVAVDCLARCRYSSVVDARFKGGYNTRHYGRPQHGVNALQLELAQANYMDEAPPHAYRLERATMLQGVLRELFDALLAWLESP